MQKKNNESEFGVFACYRVHPVYPRYEKVIVLSVDINAALATVPGAIKVERLDAPNVHIVINKAVFAMFRDRANKKRRGGA